MTPLQQSLRKDAELAVRAYGSSIGTENEEIMSNLADVALNKYFNSFPRKSLLGPRNKISPFESW